MNTATHPVQQNTRSENMVLTSDDAMAERGCLSRSMSDDSKVFGFLCALRQSVPLRVGHPRSNSTKFLHEN
jgi:hypothetical protein